MKRIDYSILPKGRKWLSHKMMAFIAIALFYNKDEIGIW